MTSDHHPALLLACSLAAVSFALPIASASLAAPAPHAALGTGCTIIGTGSCTFSCNSGDFIHVEISWTGTANASCGGAGASCVWGIDHLVTMTPCNSTGGQATSSGTGQCTATLVVFEATCSAS